MKDKIEFNLTDNQIQKLNEWKQKIKDLFGEYGQYDFIFTETGIGTALVVRSHLTKTELDLSEYDNW